MTSRGWPVETVDQTNVSKEFLEPMGYLAIWFSLLEAEIDLSIHRMLELTDTRAQVVTAQFTSFKNKCEFLKALSREHIRDETKLAGVLAAIKGAISVNSKRNALIHGEWFSGVLMPNVVFKQGHNTYGGKLNHTSKPFTPNDVMKIAEDAVFSSSVLSGAVTRALAP